MSEKISRALGPYGRGTSFGLPTSGHKEWMPCLFDNGKNRKPSEGYKNVLTNQEVRPPGGHNDPPPKPTEGAVIPLYSTNIYRKNYDNIRWNR